MRTATKLSVNVNKVATLRNTRPWGFPACCARPRSAWTPAPTASPCIRGRISGISAGRRLRTGELLKSYPHAEFNIEGNPFHQYMHFASEVRPAQCTLVPDETAQRPAITGGICTRMPIALSPSWRACASWAVASVCSWMRCRPQWNWRHGLACSASNCTPRRMRRPSPAAKDWPSGTLRAGSAGGAGIGAGDQRRARFESGQSTAVSGARAGRAGSVHRSRRNRRCVGVRACRDRPAVSAGHKTRIEASIGERGTLIVDISRPRSVSLLAPR